MQQVSTHSPMQLHANGSIISCVYQPQLSCRKPGLSEFLDLLVLGCYKTISCYKGIKGMDRL